MKWTPEAEALLKRVPFFVRRRVKKEVEEWLAKQGKDLVTEKDFWAAKEALRGKASQAKEGFSVEVCFGGAGCENALTNSEKLASELEEILKKEGITEFLEKKVGGPLKHHHQFRVGISECPNACSRIHITDFALHGRVLLELDPGSCNGCGSCEEACEEEAVKVGDFGVELDEERCVACGACAKVCPTGAISIKDTGYRVLVGGKLGRHPRLATEVLNFAKEDEVKELFRKVLRVYKEHNLKGERLGTIIERMGWERFLELVR